MKIKLILLTLPNCRNCKYYIEHPLKFDDLAKCKKFKLVNPNNITNYDFVEICRKNVNKCGLEGKEFEKI